MNGTVVELFDMYSGNDVAFNFEVKDEQGAAVDVSGWQISVTMKLNPKQTDAQAPVAIDTIADNSTQSANGIIPILLPKEQTKQLNRGKYFFELQRSYNGYVSTVMYGRVNVLGGITQRTTA